MTISSTKTTVRGYSQPIDENSALLLSIGFFIVAFVLTRHPQLPGLSSLTAPLTLLILLATVRIDRTAFSIIPVAIYCCLSLVVSSFVGNEVSVGLRFFVITIATLLAFNVKTKPISAGWALFPVSLQAFAIASFSFYLAVSQDADLASTMRGTVQLAEWGDIYSFDGFYYRVQIIGNALIPFLFMICLWQPPSKFKRWGLFTSTIGLVAAGNLTYFLVAVLSLFIRFRSFLYSKARIGLSVTLILIAVTMLFSDVAYETISVKFSGDTSSMGIRFDQIEAVVKSSSETPAAMLSGAGLGSRFPNGSLVDYSKSLYIELQALYVGYQIGLLGVVLYIGSMVYLARQRLSSNGRILFYLYLFSGISNPYILDSNQIFVTMLLVHMYPKYGPH